MRILCNSTEDYVAIITKKEISVYERMTHSLTYQKSWSGELINQGCPIAFSPRGTHLIHPISATKFIAINIKTQETVYNLYMGRNEFFLNYVFKNHFENVKAKTITSEFHSKKDGKIYGTLERSNVEKCRLKEASKFEGSIYERLKNGLKKYARYYEYIISDYPVRRSNFVNFDFSEVSFYSLSEQKDCYFARLSLKNNTKLKLYNIGDDKWISLI